MKYKIIEEKYKEFTINIKDYFINSDESIHKARNEIKIINYKNARFAVKAFKIPNIVNKIAYSYFRDSKAKKSYENSVQIIDFVPKPISYIENYKFGLLMDSYFISESFDYDFTIREPLLETEYIDKEKIFKAFAKFTFDLHEKGIYHLDYSPGNILIKKVEDEYIFKIVDINRMQFKALSKEERLLNFSKLWAKDEDLKIIIEEYAMLLNYNKLDSIKDGLKYSNIHKEKTENKKNIKKFLKK